jgi:hypothetical protein
VIRYWVCLFLVGCHCGPDEPEEPIETTSTAYAVVLESADEGIGGPLAWARPGDVLLSNEHIRLVLQQPGRSLAINPYGGNVIDADIVRSADETGQDRFGEVGLFLNAAFTIAPESMTLLSDGSNGAAVVQFEGPAMRADYINTLSGVEALLGFTVPLDPLDVPDWWITLTWTLQTGDRYATVDVEVENRESTPEPLAIAWIAHGGLGERYDLVTGGYTNPQLAQSGGLIYASEVLSYGFAPIPWVEEAHGTAAMAGGAVLMEDNNVLALLDWPQLVTAVLEPGDRYAFDAAFTVAQDPATVSSTLSSLAEAPASEQTISGVVTVEGTDTPVAGATVAALAVGSESSLGATRTDASGAWSLRVREAAVDLVFGRSGWPYDGGGDSPKRVSASAGDDLDLTLPPTGRLALTATDGNGGPLPAHVVVLGFDPSPPHPALEPSGVDPLAPGVAAMADLDVTGSMEMDLEPGHYEVLVLRGMEYDAFEIEIDLSPNQTVEVAATLHRVLDTTGWVSGDFHVHGANGPDTSLLDTTRVQNFSAEGVEVLIASDHAYVSDLAPVVSELGLEDWVMPIPSQEVTTFDYGHFGVFPLVPDLSQANQGAIDWVGMSPAELYAWALAEPREVVVQINHPRAIPTPGEMQHHFGVLDLQYGPTGPYLGPNALDPVTADLPADAVMFGPGFTAIEVMTWLNIQGLSDWFNLLNAGYLFTATANSDTHTTRVESSGWPRNFVYVGHDDPAAVDPETFAIAINAQRLSGSFGPFVTLEVESDGGLLAMQGDVLSMDTAGATIRVRVQAPLWVGVDTLDIYEGGQLILSEPLTLAEVPGLEGGVRQEQTVELPWTPDADTWIAAVVHGSQSLFPYVPFHRTPVASLDAARLAARDVDEGATAFGFANPVFVDTDGDGEVTPSFEVVAPDWDTYRREDRLDPYF